MAFNRSNFTAKKMSGELKAQTSLTEGKVNYSSNSKMHLWYKCTNGIKMFQKPKEPCKIAFNVLPFMDNGEPRFMHHDFIHMIPKTEGFGDNQYRCLGRGKCPVCAMKDEIEARAGGQAEYDDVKMYIPKRRTMMLVNPVGTDDVCLLECASVNRGKAFPEMLMNQATAMADGDGIIDFASLDEGAVVVVQFTKQTFNGHEYTDYGSIFFKARTEEISDEVLNKIPDDISELFNTSESDAADMEALINGVDVPAKTEEPTEDEKQSEFEAMMTNQAPAKEEPKQEQFLSEEDFKTDPYTKSTPKPSASDVFACPNGFDIKEEFGTHRQCMRCPMADKCEKLSG